jgi:hypothetical protein
MRFPMTHTHALVLVKLINNEKLLKRDMDPFDMVALTQVGAIKRTNNQNSNRGLVITELGKRRFVRFYHQQGWGDTGVAKLEGENNDVK